jgi:hypothetical protein
LVELWQGHRVGQRQDASYCLDQGLAAYRGEQRFQRRLVTAGDCVSEDLVSIGIERAANRLQNVKPE